MVMLEMAHSVGNATARYSHGDARGPDRIGRGL